MNNMSEYEPNPKLQNLVKQPPKDNKKLIMILAGVIAFLVLIIIILAMSGTKVVEKEVEKKQSLDEITLELENFMDENKLDALDAYGMDGIVRVAINKICTGVDNCTQIEGDEVTKYIKNVFNKEVTYSNINCAVNDGVLYTYDSENNRFVWDSKHANHGSLPTEPLYTKVNSIRRDDDKIILVLNKLYYDPAKSDYITTDPAGINQIYNANDYMHTTDNGEDIDLTKLSAAYENNFDKLKNTGTRYRYTFVKEGVRYILEKYEVLGGEEE